VQENAFESLVLGFGGAEDVTSPMGFATAISVIGAMLCTIFAAMVLGFGGTTDVASLGPESASR